MRGLRGGWFPPLVERMMEETIDRAMKERKAQEDAKKVLPETKKVLTENEHEHTV